MASSHEKEQDERREHRRLEVRLPLAYRRTDAARVSDLRTRTINVSTGGLYFETTDEMLRPGVELDLELDVPEGDERFPPHSRIKTTGRVVRCEVLTDTEAGTVEFRRLGVGAQFEKGLKLVF